MLASLDPIVVINAHFIRFITLSELKKAWQLSLTSTQGDIVRTLITKALPELAQANELPVTETFAELIHAYRMRKMQPRVRHLPKTWIKHYLEKEDLSALLFALEEKMPDIYDNEILFEELSRIVGSKPLPFVQKYLALEKQYGEEYMHPFAHVFAGAILVKNGPVLEYLFAQKERLTRNVYEIMKDAAAEVGDWGWLILALEHVPVNSWDLRMAAKGKQEAMLQFLLPKSISSYNNEEILQGYVLGGHLEAVKRMLKTNTFTRQDLEYALHRAIESKNRAVIAYILQKIGSVPAYLWGSFLASAAEQDLSTLTYFYHGRKQWPVDSLTAGLSTAMYYEKVDNVRFLLAKDADSTELEAEDQEILTQLLAGEV